MKILFVTMCYPSPQLTQYCVFLEQQAAALQRLGHTVDVYHLGDTAEQEDSDYLFHGVQVFYRNMVKKRTKADLFLPTRLTAADEKNLESVLRNGYDAVSYHFGGVDCLRSVQRICRRFHVPLIHHFHGLNVWGDYFDGHPQLTAYQNQMKRHCYKKLSATVNVSNKVRDVFRSRIGTVPSYTVYNGVDTARFFDRADRCFFQDGIVKILCAANLIPIKGQKYLIEAAAELQNMGKTVHLTFAGRGTDEEMLRNLAKQRTVSADFAGYLPYDEISALMREQDLFIMPSFYEALGCVYLEAMSAGMLTVGVKGQGIDEIIRDGENGYLVEPESAESIVQAVTRILNTAPDELKKTALCARETSMGFTWDASAEALEKVYREVIAERG